MKAYTIRLEVSVTIEAETEEEALDMAYSLSEWTNDPNTAVNHAEIECEEDI